MMMDTKNGIRMNHLINLQKKVKDSLQVNSICPFDLQQVNTDVFLTYLLSI